MSSEIADVLGCSMLVAGRRRGDMAAVVAVRQSIRNRIVTPSSNDAFLATIRNRIVTPFTQ